MYAKEPPATPGVVVSLLIFGAHMGRHFILGVWDDWLEMWINCKLYLGMTWVTPLELRDAAKQLAQQTSYLHQA